MADDKLNNRGFSLVELIVVVSILAIAAVPLMKSMSMATKTNAKAQSIQNATSLGERIMEEVKSTPIKDLEAKCETESNWTISSSGDKYTITMKDQYATQNEKFNVTVDINPEDYSVALPEGTPSKTDKVLAANVIKLPKIEEIDTASQTVLSKKELNKYDEAARSFFCEKKATFKPDDTSTYAKITSKTITFEKTNEEDELSPYEILNVKVIVTYKDDASPEANTYVRDLYTGKIVPEEKESGGYKSLDSNIYIFYKRSDKLDTSTKEIIEIKDSCTVKNPKEPSDSHRVYFIRQETHDVLPVIKIERLGNTYEINPTNYSTELTDGNKICGSDAELITNIGTTIAHTDGHIYKKEAGTRVYDIKVTLTKEGDTRKYAELESTVSVSPTPVPTTTPEPSPTEEEEP